MQNSTSSDISPKETRRFGVAVGAVVFLAGFFLGGFSFFLAVLGGFVTGGAVWFVLNMLSADQSNEELPPTPPEMFMPEAPSGAPLASAPAVETEPQAPVESAAKPVSEATVKGAPATMNGPAPGQSADLQRLKGVGPKLEAALQARGYHSLEQIAQWTPEDVAWMDANLDGFKGRVSRDDWVGQAKALLSEQV